jgi:hypothetical protein
MMPATANGMERIGNKSELEIPLECSKISKTIDPAHKPTTVIHPSTTPCSFSARDCITIDFGIENRHQSNA